MSEDENFLSRWSRRKQEVAKEAKFEEKPAARPQGAEAPSEAPAKPADVPDLTKLPSLDEITAETDISGFLRQGVPTDLTRAALRRAWTSDPAIRDFVGLQENDWVFNKPGPEQGFGPLPAAAVNVGAPALPQDVERGPEGARVGNDPPATQADRNDASHNERVEVEPRGSHGGALPRPISES
jgi:hypothetical protein